MPSHDSPYMSESYALTNAVPVQQSPDQHTYPAVLSGVHLLVGTQS